MIITLTTDFGLTDPFVGIMKGVILEIAPGVQIVDITHEVPSYDINEGAFMLDSAWRYFPVGTIHVVVVDPGVGSARRPIATSVNGHTFVAPDNGVLSWVFRSGAAVTHHITNASWFNPVVSKTFHGRDVFAPVAAHLARGDALDAVGPVISDYRQLPLPEVRFLPGNRLAGTVLRIDRFGNIITNLQRKHLAGSFRIRTGTAEVRRVASNYTEGPSGEVFAIEGSTGYIELSINQGSAAERFGVRCGSEIEVETGGANQ